MPYDSVADLPANVKKLPDKKQRQWMHVFNSCMKDGRGESTCFAMANGVAKKDVEGLDEAEWGVTVGAATFTDEELLQLEKAYQYVDSYEYESRRVSQDEANYNPVGGDSKKACSNCMFFVSPARCTAVSGDIAPNGVSDLWRAVEPYKTEPIPVVIVDGSIKAGAYKDSADDTVQDNNSFQKVVQAFAKAIGIKSKPVATLKSTEGLFITKQSDGRLRWFARYSNSWEDRDKEIITEAAHKEYVEWVSETKTYPELWLWHTKGTRLGEADWIDFADGFAHASGLIDTGREGTVQALGEKELGVSHGFLSAQQGKYITKYRTFEISILPTERAAVWTTNFNVIGKETMMGFAPDKRKFLVDALGEKAVGELEAATEKTANSLKELGVEYKSADEAQEQKSAAESVQQTEGMKALASQIAELSTIVGGLTGAVVTLKKEHDELKKTDDEKLEDAFLAKVAKAFGQNGSVVRPTASNDNVVESTTTKEAAPEDDFFSSMIMKQFQAAVGGTDASNSGVGTPAVGTVTVEQPAG